MPFCWQRPAVTASRPCWLAVDPSLINSRTLDRADEPAAATHGAPCCRGVPGVGLAAPPPYTRSSGWRRPCTCKKGCKTRVTQLCTSARQGQAEMKLARTATHTST